MSTMNPVLQKLLGGTQIGLGLAGGNSRAVSKGINTMRQPQSTMNKPVGALPTGAPPTGPSIAPQPTMNPLQPNSGGPGILNPSASVMQSPDAGGGDLMRPTLMSPGNRVQQLDMGPKPTQPGFKFPSTMYSDMG